MLRGLSERLCKSGSAPGSSWPITASWWLAAFAAAVLTALTFSRAAPAFIDRAFRGTVTLQQDACKADEPCLVAGKTNLDFDQRTFLLNATLANVNDLYTLKLWLASHAFSLAADDGVPSKIDVRPAYDSYSNANEADRTADVTLVLPFQTGKFRLLLSGPGENRAIGEIEVRARGVGKLLSALPASLRAVGEALPFWMMVAALACVFIGFKFARSTTAPARTDERGVVLLTRFGLVGAVLGTLWIFDFPPMIRGTVFLVLAILFVVPWESTRLSRRISSGLRAVEAIAAPRFSAIGTAIDRIGSTVSHKLLRVLLLAVLGTVLMGFLWTLLANGSFRWSMFEERDFLLARHLFTEGWPPLGPELLAGGRTLGNAVYWLYKPALLISDQPAALAVFNKALYFLSAILLLAIVWRHVSAVAAVFTTLVFVSSSWIVGLAYWPIHPNSSLFFSLIYLAIVMRAFVRRDFAALVIASFLLGVLVQLHFSYYLLLLPQIALMAVAPNVRFARLFGFCVAAFLLPLLPYFIWDALHGFVNIHQMLEFPRFQKTYVPVEPLLNPMLAKFLPEWFVGIGSLAIVRQALVCLALVIGLVASIRSIPAAAPDGTMSVAKVAGIYVTLPLGVLIVSGSGYAPRHMILIIPAAFMLLAIGFDRLIGRDKGLRNALASVFIALVLIDWSTGLFSAKRLKAATEGQGEWARDYENRTAVARYLIDEMGMSPDQYASRAYWWWFGWAMEPEVYRDMAGKTEVAKPDKDFDYVLLIDTPEPLPFMDHAFRWEKETTIGDVTILRAWDKAPGAGAEFSSNARTCAHLSSLEQSLDGMRVSDGVVRATTHDSVTRDGSTYLVGLAGGRIKMLLTIGSSQSDGKQFLTWRIDSPSMCGYYWELKTVWQPQLVLQNKKTGAEIAAPIVRGVLGNLFYKAPLSGQIELPTPGEEWGVSFAASGFFDQSKMKEPAIEPIRWPLDATAPPVVSIGFAADE